MRLQAHDEVAGNAERLRSVDYCPSAFAGRAGQTGLRSGAMRAGSLAPSAVVKRTHALAEAEVELQLVRPTWRTGTAIVGSRPGAAIKARAFRRGKFLFNYLLYIPTSSMK
jgi:thymidine kinase